MMQPPFGESGIYKFPNKDTCQKRFDETQKMLLFHIANVTVLTVITAKMVHVPTVVYIIHSLMVRPVLMVVTGGMAGGGSLDGLTDDQLRSLEGLERANVEARIAVLRNIQRLLDSAVAQMVQYSTVMTNMG